MRDTAKCIYGNVLSERLLVVSYDYQLFHWRKKKCSETGKERTIIDLKAYGINYRFLRDDNNWIKFDRCQVISCK